MKRSINPFGRNSKADSELDQFLRNLFRFQRKNESESVEIKSLYNENEEVAETTALLKSLSFNGYELSTDDKEKIWKNIQSRNSTVDKKVVDEKKGKSFGWLKVAASLLLFVAAVFIYFLRPQTDFYTVKTNYGETKKITLPDGSKVVLNANSILKYKKENTREVWIQGEAFFSVVHTKNNEKFLVRTLDNLSVQVLGTTFNVYNRKSKVKVVLNSGKIKLQLEGKSDVVMKPGELAEFKNSEQTYYIKDVDPSIYTSWTNKKLIFKNTPVREIAKLIEDTYGVEVIVSEARLNNQKVSGTIINENLDGLLYAVSETVEMKVLKEKDRIILKNRN
jgi:transmembrane sensor